MRNLQKVPKRVPQKPFKTIGLRNVSRVGSVELHHHEFIHIPCRFLILLSGLSGDFS